MFSADEDPRFEPDYGQRRVSWDRHDPRALGAAVDDAYAGLYEIVCAVAGILFAAGRKVASWAKSDPVLAILIGLIVACASVDIIMAVAYGRIGAR